MSNGNNKRVQQLASWKHLGELSRFEYRKGYKQAADHLVDKIVESSSGMSDFGLAYPTLFMYRHYVEIECKDILALASVINIITLPPRANHDLRRLRTTVLECSLNVNDVDTQEIFEEKGFGELFDLLHFLDPYGDSFRFPLNRNGDAQWPETKTVDILHIKETVNEFERWCEELRAEMRQYLDPGASDIDDRIFFY